MDPHELRRSLEQDIAETHKLISVTTRPVVRECLLQLFTTLEQASVHALLIFRILSESAGIFAWALRYSDRNGSGCCLYTMLFKRDTSWC